MFCSCCGHGNSVHALTISLTDQQIVDAARLAEFFPGDATLDGPQTNPFSDDDVRALLVLYARIGIRQAIQAQTDRLYPQRYPDHVESGGFRP